MIFVRPSLGLGIGAGPYVTSGLGILTSTPVAPDTRPTSFKPYRGARVRHETADRVKQRVPTRGKKVAATRISTFGIASHLSHGGIDRGADHGVAEVRRIDLPHVTARPLPDVVPGGLPTAVNAPLPTAKPNCLPGSDGG